MTAPRVPTVIDANGVPTSTVQTPFAILQPPASLPAEAQRFLTEVQQNVHQATLPARSDPLGHKTIVQAVKMTSGTPVSIRHGLGRPFTSYDCKRTYSGSAPHAWVEQDPGKYPAGQTTDTWLVLVPSASGVYDVAIYAG